MFGLRVTKFLLFSTFLLVCLLGQMPSNVNARTEGHELAVLGEHDIHHRNLTRNRKAEEANVTDEAKKKEEKKGGEKEEEEGDKGEKGEQEEGNKKGEEEGKAEAEEHGKKGKANVKEEKEEKEEKKEKIEEANGGEREEEEKDEKENGAEKKEKGGVAKVAAKKSSSKKEDKSGAKSADEESEAGGGENEAAEAKKEPMKSFEQVIEEDIKAIEGLKMGSLKEIMDKVMRVRMHCPNWEDEWNDEKAEREKEKRHELNEAQAKAAKEVLAKERTWVEECGFWSQIKVAVVNWLILLHHKGEIKDDVRLITVRPRVSMKEYEVFQPGMPDGMGPKEKEPVPIDLAKIVSIYLSVKPEEKYLMNDVVANIKGQIIWENKLAFSTVQDFFHEMHQFEKQDAKKDVQEITAKLMNIYNKEKDVLCGQDLVFKIDEDKSAEREHMNQQHAQAVHKFNHMYTAQRVAKLLEKSKKEEHEKKKEEHHKDAEKKHEEKKGGSAAHKAAVHSKL